MNKLKLKLNKNSHIYVKMQSILSLTLWKLHFYAKLLVIRQHLQALVFFLQSISIKSFVICNLNSG